MREAAEADRLSATAGSVARSAIGRTTIAAARAIIAAVAGDNDLRRLRTDPGLMIALTQDLRIAQAQLNHLLLDALLLGYRAEASGQALEGVSVTVTVTDEDRRTFSSYPVVGGSNPPKAYTVGEIATDLTRRLETEVSGTLAAPIAGKADPAGIPAALASVAEGHSTRVSAAVAEAYFAGVSAGFRALHLALVS